MNYREVEIFSPKDIGTDGVEVIDINVKDILSSIELIFRTTVVTVDLMTAPHAACISRIEVVDGSDVLISLSGEEAQALAFYGTGRMPLNTVSLVVGEYMRSVIPIYFGRKLFDKLLALDPKRFKNLQLKVTWDEDAANTTVVANQLTVRGWAFDEKVGTPRGFLMSKEVKNYTPANDSYAYTDLPVDYPYRLLMLRSKSTTIEPGIALAQVKLSEEHDKRVPIDMTGDEIAYKTAQEFGEVEENYKAANTAAAVDIYGAPTVNVGVFKDINITNIAANDDIGAITVTNNKYAIAISGLVLNRRVSARGLCPHSCLALPMGDLNDIDDWYDVTKLGNLRLTTLGAAAVGTSPSAQVVLQQLRGY